MQKLPRNFDSHKKRFLFIFFADFARKQLTHNRGKYRDNCLNAFEHAFNFPRRALRGLCNYYIIATQCVIAVNGSNEITNIIVSNENACVVYNAKLIYFETLHQVVQCLQRVRCLVQFVVPESGIYCTRVHDYRCIFNTRGMGIIRFIFTEDSLFVQFNRFQNTYERKDYFFILLNFSGNICSFLFDQM